MMKEPDSFKEHWSMLIPKIRDRWPKLTNEDIEAIHGDLEVLAERVRDRYGWTRAEVMNELTALTQMARIEGRDVEAGSPKISETADATGPRGS
jgi:uncharacterized protein YjbJ (UPF0337 family)